MSGNARVDVVLSVVRAGEADGHECIVIGTIGL